MAIVLIVEDDAALLRAMAEILTLDDHEVWTVESAEAALETLQRHRPDLIVADVLMPGMSGIQLAEAVRANPDWQDIPILFASASTTLAHEGEITSIERAAFLRKPFSGEALRSAVLEALDLE